MELKVKLATRKGLEMEKKTVKFGVFTDLHLEIMNDGERRLKEFISNMKEENVDFVIQLGDFCYPNKPETCFCSDSNMPVNLKNALIYPILSKNEEMRDLYNSFEKPHYHVLGNHEQDFGSKEEAMTFYGMEKRYYSFEVKNWKMIVIDASNFKTEDGCIKAYDHGDYFDSRDLPYIDEEQMKWLEKELMSSIGPAIVFSHQPLNEGPRGIRNAKQLSELFHRAFKKGRKVHFCINGHIHVDRYQEWNGVGYLTLNSMSNHWIGTKYACKRYDNETEMNYPNLQYTFPYKQALYSVVELSDEKAVVKGISGSFIMPSPDELGLPKNSVPGLSAGIQNRVISWT